MIPYDDPLNMTMKMLPHSVSAELCVSFSLILLQKQEKKACLQREEFAVP